MDLNPPLDDHAAMYVAATRSQGHRPCIGLVRRFDEALPAECVTKWVHDMARNPVGFGRRVVKPRLPGARPRWVAAPEPPPLRYFADCLDQEQLLEVLEDEVSSRPDPAHSAGWRVAAARTWDGATVVTLWLNHAFGDARSILANAFDTVAPPAVGRGQPRGRGYDTVEELADVVQRVRLGIEGSFRLGREAATGAWLRPGGDSDLRRLGPMVSALSFRDPSVGARSGRRNVALVRVPARDWEEAGRAHGGSGNALLMEFLANLLRGARASRGEILDRPLRIVMPVDLRRQASVDDPSANAVAGATVVLPGGRPRHGDLGEVRHAIRGAVARIASQRRSARRRGPGGPTGMVDAMRLLPTPFAYRMAVRAQRADGVASNIGSIPPQVATLGPHRAADMYLLGGPMMTDVTVCCGRAGDNVTLGVVADAARQGPGGSLQARVSHELKGWGLAAHVW